MAGNMKLAVLATVLMGAGMANAAILMDLGQGGATQIDALSRTWNVVGEAAGETAPFGLLDTTGAASGVSVSMSNLTAPTPATAKGFTYFNTNGVVPQGDTLARGYPSFATQDSLFGSVGAHSGTTAPDVLMTFTGLIPGTAYDLFFHAARVATENRQTQYVATGLGSPMAAFVDVSGNSATPVTVTSGPYAGTNVAQGELGQVAVISGIQPDASGTLTVAVAPGPDNNNSLKYYYLGVMEIQAVPEPAALGILGLAGMLLMKRRQAI